MTKRTRTILFLVCLFLFLSIAPTAIFYSQGYRFDFETKKITQTGGLFLKAEPKQVEVFIDGKLKKKTDFFFGSALTENLLPKKYKIQMKKEGYYPWEKNLEIREKEVTEAKKIVLIPENPNFNILTEEVKDFWFSPDERKIILKENPPAGGETGWALKLYDLEKNVKSHLVEEKDVYSKGADLLKLEFSPDSKKIYLNIGMKEQEKNFVLGLDKVPPVLTERKITPQTEDIVTSQVFNEENYYLDNSGHLFKNEERLTEKPFPVKPETKYALEIFQNFVFLHEGQVLYQFNPDLKSFEKFFEPIKDLKISPDYKKIVYFSDYEIWILFLEKINDQPKRESRDKLFLIRLSEQIKDCFWLNSDYLIFNAANKTKIAEIDDRDRINVVDVAEFENPKIFWNQFDKKLYVLSDSNLYQSERLLP